MTDSEIATERQASPTDRQVKIRDRVLRNGYVTIDELSSELAVSAMTIHRDLEVLGNDGWLLKVRGGARVHPSALLDTTVRSRAERMVTEKKAIATQALTHVTRGQVIMFDESTTGLAMADGLSEFAPLTVITSFLSTVNKLSGQPGIELICLGGTYDPGYDSFFGILATETVARLQADVLFMSTTAIEGGNCFHKSQETVQLKRAFMQSAGKKILLVDHAKFSQRALHRLAPITDFDLVIVDEGADPETLEDLRARGVSVEIAPRNY